MFVPPYQFPPQLMYPVSIGSWLYGTPEWRPLVQPTGWFLNAYHYATNVASGWDWGFFADFYRSSDGSYGWFGTQGYLEVPPVSSMVFGSQSPADWCFHFLDVLSLRPMPYSELPANFCTGA
jgi:hypothetical protein